MSKFSMYNLLFFKNRLISDVLKIKIYTAARDLIFLNFQILFWNRIFHFLHLYLFQLFYFTSLYSLDIYAVFYNSDLTGTMQQHSFSICKIFLIILRREFKTNLNFFQFSRVIYESRVCVNFSFIDCS